MIKNYEIEFAVATMFDYRKNIIVSNLSWGVNCHECDLFIMNKKGYATEVKIKVTLSDLKADSKKSHNHFDKRIKYLYYAIPEYLYDKAIDLIPYYAGIIVCKEIKYFINHPSKNHHTIVATIKRKAIQRSNEQLTLQQMYDVARLGSMRAWKIISLQRELDRLKNLIKSDIKTIKDLLKKTGYVIGAEIIANENKTNYTNEKHIICEQLKIDHNSIKANCKISSNDDSFYYYDVVIYFDGILCFDLKTE